MHIENIDKVNVLVHKLAVLEAQLDFLHGAKIWAVIECDDQWPSLGGMMDLEERELSSTIRDKAKEMKTEQINRCKDELRALGANPDKQVRQLPPPDIASEAKDMAA